MKLPSSGMKPYDFVREHEMAKRNVLTLPSGTNTNMETASMCHDQHVQWIMKEKWQKAPESLNNVYISCVSLFVFSLTNRDIWFGQSQNESPKLRIQARCGTWGGGAVRCKASAYTGQRKNPRNSNTTDNPTHHFSFRALSDTICMNWVCRCPHLSGYTASTCHGDTGLCSYTQRDKTQDFAQLKKMPM